MKKPLDLILLVDDDPDDNFFHKRVIERTGVAQKVEVVENGKEALTFLTNQQDERYPQPDLIFLDINMPVMDGWEFLDAYTQLSPEQQAKTIIVMLTTSLNPDDESRAIENQMVNGFRSKPLRQKMLLELIEQYFPDRV